MIDLIWRRTIVAAVLAFYAAYSSSQGAICGPEPEVAIGLFNGVLTTESQFRIQLKEVEKRLTPASSGIKVSYLPFYNGTSSSIDFAEVYIQRMKELDPVFVDRLYTFFELQRGEKGYTATILDAFPQFKNHWAITATKLVDASKKSILDLSAKLVSNIDGQEKSTRNAHKVLIDYNATRGRKLIMLAHSQGNLFVNSALEYAVGRGLTVRAVHVAPASTAVGDRPYTRVNRDRVLNALDLVAGNVPPVTTYIDEVYLTAYDLLGHGLLEIYLNKDIGSSGGDNVTPFERIYGHLTDALRELASCIKITEATCRISDGFQIWSLKGVAVAFKELTAAGGGVSPSTSPVGTKASVACGSWTGRLVDESGNAVGSCMRRSGDPYYTSWGVDGWHASLPGGAQNISAALAQYRYGSIYEFPDYYGGDYRRVSQCPASYKFN